MSNAIHLGYEVGTGEPIEIPLRHTAVTGQTQESGKTTTLEGLIARSGRKAVAYVTKRGESSFHVMYPIAPYFQERADWKFVQSLLEASTETKLKFEQSWIMRASEGARTLQDVRANIQKFLTGVRDTRPVKARKGAETKERWLQKPARGLSGDIYYVLNKYLDDIMPQLDRMPYSKKLELAPGLNVMDLRDYEFPLQALVVRSVIDWVHDHGENTINVIPEAWKFAPKQKGSPVRQSAEEMVREGAAMKNFLWIDSHDLAGVADVLMRQVSVWLFGVQRAKHEIERALDHMPEGLPVRRPRPQDIATLSKGQFYVCFAREMYKVYVQPAWMTGAHAEAIARGEEEVDSAREILKEYDHEKKRDERIRQNQRAVGSIATMGKETSSAADLGSVSNRSAAPEKATNENADLRTNVHDANGEEEAMWKENANAVHSAALDPEADFDTPTRTEPAAQQAHGSLLAEQPPKPKVVGDRFEAFYLKPIFAKTPKGDITVSLAMTLPLEDSHDGLLPKIIHDGYRDITKKGRKGMTFTELPGQHAAFYLTSDIKEESLVLPAAKMINASLALIQRKGEGEARKVIRLSFRLQVKLSKEVAHFAEHNLGNNFWISLKETEEPLFDEEDSD